MKHYIISYGTLMHPDIAALTGKACGFHPCVLQGYQRRWTFPVPEEQRTAAGVERNPTAKTESMILEVGEGELPKFDIRETGYTRDPIAWDQIEILTDETFEGQAWLYVPEQPEPPTKEHPLVQTMVDSMVAAWLTVGEDYARSAVLGTADWEHPWLNDRDNPRYPRYVPGVPTARIDALLEELIPDAFAQRSLAF